MAFTLKIDHKTMAMSAIALTSGLAVYSTYKYYSLRRQKHKENVYESEKSLSEYLVFHYGSRQDLLPYSFGPHDSLDFPKKCADICMKNFTKKVSLGGVTVKRVASSYTLKFVLKISGWFSLKLANRQKSFPGVRGHFSARNMDIMEWPSLNSTANDLFLL